MNKKILGYIALVIVVILAIFLIFKPKEVAQTPGAESADILLFSRYDCPHCQEVEAYINQNKIEEQVKFIKKEVHIEENALLFMDKAAICEIPEEVMGVPMLWDGKTCFIGTDDIINYLNGVVATK
ncbi:hypothetical protein KKA13_03800 [Patescibacteria group bacterium]|nr:hypothetical protein [Patescibacteria group bacterium]MBU1612877.1 hypothetical protein [Patescibacteria group bacterium]